MVAMRGVLVSPSIWRALLLGTAFVSVAVAGFAQTDPNQLVREVVQHEVASANSDHSHWSYRQQHTEPAKTVSKECVDTSEGSICRRLAEGGHELTAQEQQEEKRRIQSFLNNPAEQRKEQKARQEDGDKALQMLKMLPDAFTYRYDGQEGNYARLKFEPNPNFNPPNREARVFHCMSGFLWVDPKRNRLAALQGRLLREIKFGGGLFGHLDSGGTFAVNRRDVGDNHWETTLLDVNIHGKVLFFKSINAQQHEVTDNFKRVPDNLSLAQGASMLEKPAPEAKLNAAMH